MKKLGVYQQPGARWLHLHGEIFQLFDYDQYLTLVLHSILSWQTAALNDLERTDQDGRPWIEVSREQIRRDCFGMVSERKIGECLDTLSTTGFVTILKPYRVGGKLRISVDIEALNGKLRAMPEGDPGPRPDVVPARRNGAIAQRKGLSSMASVPPAMESLDGIDATGPMALMPPCDGIDATGLIRNRGPLEDQGEEDQAPAPTSQEQPKNQEPDHEQGANTEGLGLYGGDLEDSLENFVRAAYSQKRRISFRKLHYPGFAERLADWEVAYSPPIFRAALLLYLDDESSWLREEKWPLAVFLKHLAKYTGQMEGTMRKPTRAAAEPRCPGAARQGGTTNTQPAPANPVAGLISSWDQAFPDTPVKWNLRHDPVMRLRKLATDPEFMAAWPAVCEKVAKIRKAKQGDWAPDFRWLLRADPDKGDNWWRVYSGELDWLMGNGKRDRGGGRKAVDTDAVTREALASLRKGAES